MRVVCQRVSSARVTVDGKVVSEIGHGLLVLLGVARGDSTGDAERLARKVAQLRIFEGSDRKLDRSVLDVGGAALVVSQFTLIADTQAGNRPSFAAAAPESEARSLYELFCDTLARGGLAVEKGMFGARMAVTLVNEGPVTIVLD